MSYYLHALSDCCCVRASVYSKIDISVVERFLIEGVIGDGDTLIETDFISLHVNLFLRLLIQLLANLSHTKMALAGGGACLTVRADPLLARLQAVVVHQQTMLACLHPLLVALQTMLMALHTITIVLDP